MDLLHDSKPAARIRTDAGSRILFVLNHTPAEQQVTLPDEYARFGRNGVPGAREFRIAARDVIVLFENA